MRWRHYARAASWQAEGMSLQLEQEVTARHSWYSNFLTLDFYTTLFQVQVGDLIQVFGFDDNSVWIVRTRGVVPRMATSKCTDGRIGLRGILYDGYHLVDTRWVDDLSNVFTGGKPLSVKGVDND